MMNDWYRQTTAQVISTLVTNETGGLAESEAALLLTQSGPNELVESAGRSQWKILWEQLSSIIIIILIVAAVISFFLGEYVDGIVILIIVILNAALGFQQEYKAEQSMAALK